jgi:hypothetical protein
MLMEEQLRVRKELLAHTGFLFPFLFKPEDESDWFLQNVH